MTPLRGWEAAGLLLVLFGGTGCGFLTTPPVRYFEVRPLAGTAQAGAVLPALMVPDFSCNAAYDHLRLVTRKSVVEVEASRHLQWTAPPGRMLAQGMRARLEATGRFQTVRRDVTPRPPYVVEGLVQVIELSEEDRLEARLALHLNIRRTADGTSIGEETIEEALVATGDNLPDGVLALRDLYSRILDRVVAEIITIVERDLSETRSVP